MVLAIAVRHGIGGEAGNHGTEARDKPPPEAALLDRRIARLNTSVIGGDCSRSTNATVRDTTISGKSYWIDHPGGGIAGGGIV